MRSVMSVCPQYLLNELTFGLKFCICIGRHRCSSGIGSRLEVCGSGGVQREWAW